MTAVMALAWFRREDYDRIKDVCDDEMVPTFVEWETKMTKIIADLAARGIVVEKMIVDPDELIAFARRSGAGRIDSKVRSTFAAFLLEKKRSTH